MLSIGSLELWLKMSICSQIPLGIIGEFLSGRELPLCSAAAAPQQYGGGMRSITARAAHLIYVAKESPAPPTAEMRRG